jgi:hypothetical protein
MSPPPMVCASSAQVRDMAVFIFTSCSGSPGTTSFVQTLAGCWPRRSMLLEADPDGGRLAARCGLPVRPGLVDLAAITRSGRVNLADLARVAQRNSDGVDVLVAHPAPEQVTAILDTAAPRIGDALSTLTGIDILVDIGRLRPTSPAMPLVRRGDQIVIVCGSRLEDVAAIVHRESLLSDIGDGADIGLVVAAPGEHSAEELARAVGRPLIGVRPGRSARRTSERIRRRESAWIRSIATDLVARVAADGVGDDGRLLLDHLTAAHAATSPFALPTGPPVPGPVPVAEMT